ncbi:EF hand [compost metagenome]
MSQPRNWSLLIAATMAATMLAGCGMGGTTVGLQGTQAAGFDAAASATLRKGFKEVHTAIFSKIDSNGDNYIDEYEAGPFFNLTREFPKADKGKNGKGNGKISRTEFMKYATAGGFLMGNDNPDKFLDRMRAFLATAFTRLDKREGGLFGTGDKYLTQEELSSTALRSLGLGFAYEKLHVRVRIDEVSSEDFAAADVTGDGKISQGEWEDLYMKLVTRAINPNAGSAPTPPADPGAGAPADPGAGALPADTSNLWEWWRL